jgi:hypothetical protein
MRRFRVTKGEKLYSLCLKTERKSIRNYRAGGQLKSINKEKVYTEKNRKTVKGSNLCFPGTGRESQSHNHR